MALAIIICRSESFSSRQLENVLLHSFVRLLKTIGHMPLLHLLYGKKKTLLFGGICTWTTFFISFSLGRLDSFFPCMVLSSVIFFLNKTTTRAVFYRKQREREG